MVNAILWSIAEHCTTHNLGFMQTLKYEREQCIPYNRHVKRRLDAIKRRIMNEWER